MIGLSRKPNDRVFAQGDSSVDRRPAPSRYHNDLLRGIPGPLRR